MQTRPSDDQHAHLTDWTPRPAPQPIVHDGQVVRLEPLDVPRHAEALFEAYAEDSEGAVWRYMLSGPFTGYRAFEKHAIGIQGLADPLYFAIIDKASGRASGLASFMRIVPEQGVIEVGNISLSPRLQRSRAATEAMYLMARHAFDDLGYRRYEWKCNAANARSCRAAERLGFTFEGVFRQHMVVKGRNRDTAWYAMLDGDWPGHREALERWLDPGNFDADGRQIKRLEACRSGTVTKGVQA